MDYNNKTSFVFSNEFISFTHIPNYIFQDSTLSYKAIGLYCSILQYQNSPNHKISIKGLQALHTDGETSVANGLKELIKAGFITREQIRDSGRTNGFLYTVYMKPVTRETLENKGVAPRRGNHDTGKPDTENRVNKKENIKKQNIKKQNITTTKTEVPKRHTDTINQNRVVVKSQQEKDLIIQELKDIKLSDKDISTLMSIADTELILEKIKLLHTQKSTRNVLGFLIAAIKQDYQQTTYAPQSNQPKPNNRFVNYEQREWDFDELKKLEREYAKRRLQQ